MTTAIAAIVLAHSKILTAFHEKTVGSKVTNKDAFTAILVDAINAHDTSKDRTSGQHFIVLPDEAKAHVACGDARVDTHLPEDFIVRFWRGEKIRCLPREKAEPVETVAAVVYTLDAYGKDPQVDMVELDTLKAQGATHVLVAVIASAGPNPQMSPERLVANLAGGNNDYAWLDRIEQILELGKGEDRAKCSIEGVKQLKKHAADLRKTAKGVADYNAKWCRVAD